jgi:hypothetical protein
LPRFHTAAILAGVAQMRHDHRGNGYRGHVNEVMGVIAC